MTPLPAKAGSGVTLPASAYLATQEALQGEGAERILSQAFTQYELCSYCYKLERGINEILDRYFKDNGLNAEAGLLSLSHGPITSLREFRVRLLQAAVTVTCRKWSLL